ncbi:MAG: acyl-CoA desaturase [Armatimonadetes bacterium]|nr:acyl-CoA desaturase [Armatimonadota bacterium]
MLAALKKLNIVHVLFITIIHAMAFAALWYRPRLVDVSLLVVMYALSGFGITIGFHRLIAHRGFSCPAWLRHTLAFLGTSALQGGPISWTANHRRHHQVSDREQDPHSTVFGLFYSHMGWILLKSREHRSRLEHLVKDLRKDAFMRWLDRPFNSIVPALTLGVLCYLVAGVQGVLWGTFLRTVLVWHATWCVNSFCHFFGSRMYATPDKSTNLWWVGLFALGEGWHNNHHASPRVAFHGRTAWQIDASACVIKFMERLGLARDVIRPKTHVHEAEELQVAS